MPSLNHRNKPWVSLKVILATAHTIELNGCWSVTERCQEIFGLTNPWSRLGTASFLILSLWKLYCWTTGAPDALPNSPSNATRDKQTEKNLSIERKQRMRKVWRGREKNSWDGIRHIEQRTSNLDYSIKSEKALTDQLFLVINNVLSILIFLQTEELQKDQLGELQAGRDLNTVTLEKSQSSGSSLGCSLLDGNLNGSHVKAVDLAETRKQCCFAQRLQAQQRFSAHTLGSLKNVSQIHRIFQIKHELKYL